MTDTPKRTANRRNFHLSRLEPMLVEALAREDAYRETLDAIPVESNTLKDALADALAAVLTSSQRTSE